MEPAERNIAEQKLGFSIHSCSSYSSSYFPENVLCDKPSDQSSRWSSDTNTPPQYLTLKLDRTAVVTRISFGKFEKNHVCNLKRFQILGGLAENSMIELLESGLKNDNQAESFRLRHQLNKQFFPVNFVKIVPLQSWGPSFNYSVWFVALFGDDSPELAETCITWHRRRREQQTIRLCMKHFRQHNYTEAFAALAARTQVELEAPLLTRLHELVVVAGDYTGTEELLSTCLQDGVFSQYLAKQQPHPAWTGLILPGECGGTAVAAESGAVQPGPAPRGGHQLVMDPLSQNIYLFGGWDGSRDLSDFWQYSVAEGSWRLLSSDTTQEGGPPPRSCHKMVLDPHYRQIFVLGRYLERGLRDSHTNTRSDFFVYDMAAGRWTQITDDTAALGGPGLIFDHQMCIDLQKRSIYVFGGQSLFPLQGGAGEAGERSGTGGMEKKFSGLYRYHVADNSWQLLREDGAAAGPGSPPLRSRTGHSMLFNTADRKLYIFGGQRRRDEYLNDFFTFQVDSGEVEALCEGAGAGEAIPAVGYTQRATIDCKRGEIFVMTGLNKDKDKEKRFGEPRVSNSFWVYEISSEHWSCIYRNENSESGYWRARQRVEPRPRYAHQLVYDEERGVHYMFGGNPGGKEMTSAAGRARLGDFWRLELQRPRPAELQRKLVLAVRRARYQELAPDPLQAVRYLQGELASCVDHDDATELSEFQQLAGQVFAVAGAGEQQSQHKLRTNLYDDLVKYFPPEMTQPAGNLLDLIPLDTDIS